MSLIRNLQSYRRFLLWVWSRLRTRDWFNIFLLYNTFYFLVVIISFYSITRIHQIGGQTIINSPRLFAGFFKWDALSYLSIAKNDYPRFGSMSAFMPLYPYLSYYISQILHISTQSGMLIVSYLSGLSCFWLIYKISNIFFINSIKYKKLIGINKSLNDTSSDNIQNNEKYYRGIKYGFIALLIFAILPTSFVIILPYADGLFMALTLATIALALKRKWFLSAFMASLSVLAQPIGIFIIIFWVLEYLSSIRFKVKSIDKNLAFIILPIISISIYLYWAYYRFGDSMAVYHAQYYINRYFNPNLNILWVWLRELFLLIDLGFKQKYIETFLNELGYFLSWTLVFYALLKMVRLRIISISLSLYFIAVMMVMLCGGNFVSMNRYVLFIIPFLWWLILRLGDKSAFKYFILALSISVLIINIALFSNGFWVF